MNRRLFLCASALPLLGLGGCATEALYKKISEKEYRDYKEPVSQILVSGDGKKIVVLGETYHYIFDTPPKLIEILDSPLHPKLSAVMHQFDAKPDGSIEGSFILWMPKDATDTDEQLAQSYGFRKRKGEGASMTFALGGKRYSAKGFTVPATGQIKQFNMPYSVSIREELPTGGKAALTLLTPVTVAADGALVILGVAGAIALIPFAAIAVVAIGATGAPMPMMVR